MQYAHSSGDTYSTQLAQIRETLHRLTEQLRSAAGSTSEPQTAALLETSAEVVNALERAFQHWEMRGEPGWRR